jgi:uncharacterized membrane protein
MSNNQHKVNSRTLAIVALLVIVVMGAGYYALHTTGQASENISTANSATSNSHADTLSYPLSLFEDGQARHFEHKSDGLTIRYFVLKSSDGVVRAAFDACDVCWPAGKGYVQSGDEMICRNCGRRFASVLINEVKGGCNPAPLNRTIQGGQLIIKVNDILSGQQYFNFKGKA